MRLLALACFCGLTLIGCTPAAPKVTYARMGAAAPVFGATPPMSNFQTFVQGYWTTAMVVDPNMLKQFNLEGFDEPVSEEVDTVFHFAADGTATLTFTEFKAGGTWTVNGNVLTMTFTTLNGKPMATAKAEAKAREEKGTQGGIAGGIFLDKLDAIISKFSSVVLASDKKRLVTPDGMGANAGAMMGATPNGLERLSTTP